MHVDREIVTTHHYKEKFKKKTQKNSVVKVVKLNCKAEHKRQNKNDLSALFSSNEFGKPKI